MGVDYTSYAAIGVRVDPAKLKTTKQVRSCSCKIGSDRSGFFPKFCPCCGKHFTKQETDWIDGCLPRDCTPETFEGFPLAFSTDEKEMVICAKMVRTKYGSELEMSPLDDETDRERMNLRDVLAPLGLWNRSQYGLWAIQRCSY